jgi:hypothetical protein
MPALDDADAGPLLERGLQLRAQRSAPDRTAFSDDRSYWSTSGCFATRDDRRHQVREGQAVVLDDAEELLEVEARHRHGRRARCRPCS